MVTAGQISDLMSARSNPAAFRCKANTSSLVDTRMQVFKSQCVVLICSVNNILENLARRQNINQLIYTRTQNQCSVVLSIETKGQPCDHTHTHTDMQTHTNSHRHVHMHT